jgi:hypothetical protein
MNWPARAESVAGLPCGAENVFSQGRRQYTTARSSASIVVCMAFPCFLLPVSPGVQALQSANCHCHMTQTTIQCTKPGASRDGW